MQDGISKLASMVRLSDLYALYCRQQILHPKKEPLMYSPHTHGRMIADRIRVGAYRRALEEVVTPSAVVVDMRVSLVHERCTPLKTMKLLS